MGWKASAIIVSPVYNADIETVLSQLGFKNLTLIDDETVESAIYPDDNQVYVGFYKNNLLICAQEFPMPFFDTHISEKEAYLNDLFPGSEVCAIGLQSVINFWAYSVSKDGQKIRVRMGTADSGTIIDSGAPLAEENDLLNQSTVDSNGKRTYCFNPSGNECYTEDQVGENFVFAITGRYFGEPLDQADELLFETSLTGYSFSSIGSVNATQQFTPTRANSVLAKKPWWKLWS
ncbi:MAG: hypothetical protein HYZ14_03535 [Bacteroidetes bacterium]|nr:hypothetical protein [Bacteroidota bacterium]